MPRLRKPVAADAQNVQSDGTAGKQRLYEILYHLNQGFEQVLAQLQELARFGIRRQTSKKFLFVVEETRAEVNFELVDLLYERELKDWSHFGRLRERPRMTQSPVAGPSTGNRRKRGTQRNDGRE